MKSYIAGILAVLTCLALAGCRKDVSSVVTETVPNSEISLKETMAPTETFAAEMIPQPQDAVFVAAEDYIPDIHVELKYAAEDNFTGKVIYEFSTAYLRYGTVRKLAAVQADLRELGLGLKIWDGFRPVSAQFKLWEVCPDSRYVANPEKGFSNHNRGNAVDVTLVDSEGKELPMPTDFDDFTEKADRDYSDCSEEAANNAQLLEILMEKHGFSGYYKEWWHYSDTVTYPVEEYFQPTY